MKPDLFALVINPQPAVSHGCLHANSSRRTRHSFYSGALVNLAVLPFRNILFGKLFNVDYLKTDISLLQSLLEVRV